jgi:hypothetical protein
MTTGASFWVALLCGTSVALGVSACSDSDQADGSGGSGASASGGASASAGTGGGLQLEGGAGSGASDAGFGNELECDGIDNDQNGIIDDVDIGKDGICDCLKIATLGLAGQWGDGDVFSKWLDDRSVLGATGLNDQLLTAALLDQFQVIVIQDVSKIGRSYAPAEVSALESWLRQGGGLMTLIGYGDASEIVNVNTLLAPLGASYGSQQILAKQGGSTVPISQWVPHPVTKGVSLLGVDNGYPVQGAGSPLASEQGFDVLRAAEIAQGKLLFWGDEWITYDSEWTGHPEYQVELFWLNAIKWLTPADQCQVPIPPTVH